MIEEERKIAESSPEAADAVTREQTAETTTVKAAEKTAGNTADILSGNTIGNAAGIPSGNTIKNAAGNTVEDIADKPKSRKRDILETVLYLAVVVGICLLFIRFVAYRCVVEGSSMEHYLEDKDNLIAERITYYFRKPERFEVIIFKREGESRHGQEKGDSLIKRIIGLPGETVSISNGKVSINGMDLNIKKVTLKNVKNAYVSPNSIFKGTISSNNLSAYSAYSERKLPGIVITIDTKGADKETKKAAKKANKMLKKNPVGFDLLPVNLTSSNVSVDKYNDSKQAVKKLSVTDQNGNTSKLKKKDFSSEASGDQNVITGEVNYNGQVLYDPATNTIKAI